MKERCVSLTQEYVFPSTLLVLSSVWPSKADRVTTIPRFFYGTLDHIAPALGTIKDDKNIIVGVYVVLVPQVLASR